MNARRTLVRGIAVVAVTATAALTLPSVAAAHGTRPATGATQECRGVRVDPDAPVISRSSVLIEAPLSKVWRLHTGVDRWSDWIPEITPARKRTPGPLRPGSVFTWSPQDMKVTSTVASVRPGRCIAWGGPVDGIDGVHLWTFEKVRGGVLATTEESWSGAPVEADVPGHQAGLDAALHDWTRRLKDVAETR